MKFYLDKYGELLTEKQFKKRFFTKKIIFNMLLDGYFHNEFIEICNERLGKTDSKEVLNYFIQCIQQDKKLFASFCDYWNIEEKEIDNEKIIEELKDN